MDQTFPVSIRMSAPKDSEQLQLEKHEAIMVREMMIQRRLVIRLILEATASYMRRVHWKKKRDREKQGELGTGNVEEQQCTL